MTEFNEVMEKFILDKTQEERKIILNLLEEWEGKLILMGVGENVIEKIQGI